MLQQISWSAYLQFIVYILLPYYAAIIFIYYRKDLYVKFSRYGQWEQQGDVSFAAIDGKANGGHNDHAHTLMPSVHDLMDELKILTRSAARNGFQKEELMMALEMQLRPYAQLKGTYVQSPVDSYIMEQVKEECGMVLEEREVKNLWK